MRTLLHETIGGMRETISATIAPWAEANPDALPVGAEPAEWAALTAPVVMSLIPGFALQRTMFDDFDEDAYVRGIDGILPS